MNLLVTDLWVYAKNHIKEIEDMGYTVYEIQRDDSPLPSNLRYEDIDGVIGFRIFCYHPIELFTNLKFIQLTSVGIDHMDLDYINSKGIVFRHAPGAYAIPMAEYTIMRILEFYKHIKDTYKRQENHIWHKDRTLLELYGKNVLIIGFGDYGRETVNRLRGFSVNISVCNRTIKSHEAVSKCYELKDLDKALANQDIVILTIANAPETYHIIGKKELDLMKTSAIIVNATRGTTLDTNALINALNNKDIAGAILDVFEKEPLPEESVLWDIPNVLISSHNSFVGDNNDTRLWEMFKKTLLEMKK